MILLFQEEFLSIKKLPDYRLKQKMLYIENTSADDLINYGNLFLEGGALSEALDFFQKANHNKGIEQIKNIAIDSGDVMLFQHAAKAMNLELLPSDWETIGKKAIELKKYYFARHALEKANNEDMLQSLRNIMKAEEQEIGS
jgi:tetratricopeptide (TPR) repeat protein